MAQDYGLNAVGEKANIQRGDLVRFWAEDLLPNDENYRFGSFDTDPAVVAARDAEIEEMVVSLCAEGQKQPIVIRPVSGSRFKVHAGDTRHQAFLRINQRGIWPWAKPEDEGRGRIECKVEKFGDDSAKEAFGSSIVENLQRNNLTVIDLANAVSVASNKYQYTDAEIMAKFRQTDPAWLPNMRRLAKLPIVRKREIHLGTMKASVGYLLAEIPESEHEAVLADAVAQPIDDNATAPRLAEDGALTTEQTLDYTDTQVRQPAAKKASSKPKKVTARGVATAAKARGLLKHKKVSNTLAGMREFWEPIITDRPGSLVSRLASANLAWIDDADNDKFWLSIVSILKVAK